MNRRLAFRTDDEHSQMIKDTWTNKKAANYMNVQFKGNQNDHSACEKIISLS